MESAAMCISRPSIKPRALLTGVLAALLLGACAVGPRYAPPDVTALSPAALASVDPTASAAPPVNQWWTALADPALDALVARALLGNQDLAAAEARVQQARALARVAGADYYPQAALDGRIGRDKLSRNGENLALIPFKPPTTQFTDFRLGLDASWEIDLAGKTRRTVEAAVARSESVAESRHDAEIVLAAAVADAYVDYRGSTERLAIAERTVAGRDETLRLVTLERDAGLASDMDRRQAQADRQQAAAVIPPLAAERQGALFELAALTGTDAAPLDSELATAVPIPTVPAGMAVGLPSTLLRRRPDVRRAERELAAATADVGGAIAAQYPRRSLVGDFGFDAVHAGQFASAASRYWNFGPQLALPLFQGGRLHGNIEAAEAAQDAALASYRSAVLQAFSDAESAIVRFAGERRRESGLADALLTLEAALGLAQRRYDAGDTSMIELLAAQRARDAAADEDAASRTQLARYYVALGKALGGGWQDSESAPVR
jgi:NodT family efflux transporter outer membrane factor (OMF) lipoprotein